MGDLPPTTTEMAKERLARALFSKINTRQDQLISWYGLGYEADGKATKMNQRDTNLFVC